MENLKISTEGSKVTITFDAEHRGGKSSSGKTTIVATTSGNVPVPGFPHIKIGVNAYVK